MANVALNPAAMQWARDKERENVVTQQNLTRTTMELANTDKALQESITRLNANISRVEERNAYLEALIVTNARSITDERAITINTWSTDIDLRPAVTVTAPSGRIGITISGYGSNTLLTYSIAGVVDRDANISSYLNRSAQLVLPGGTASMSSQRDWVQNIPRNQNVTVRVECWGQGESPRLASPSIIVQVLPE